MATGSKGTSRGVEPRGAGRLLHRPGNGLIVRRGARVSLVVGTILTVINEGPTVVAGHPDLSLIPRAVLNYVVPFCVSCYSAAAARRGSPGKPAATGDEPGPPVPTSHTSGLGEGPANQ